MPIQAPKEFTEAPAKTFEKTTAAYRKTGPVKNFGPMSDKLKADIINKVGPIAPRVDELRKEGKSTSVTTILAAETASKLQKKENLDPGHIAGVMISVEEALKVGLEDPNSPYYQADNNLRNQREAELLDLRNELNAYLTGGDREIEDVPITETNRRWGWRNLRITPGINRVPGWLSSTLHSGVEIPRPGRTTTTTTRVEQRPRAAGTPLSAAEIAAAETQSRVTEAWQDAQQRIAREKYGKTYGALTLRERRLVTYSTSDELTSKFDGARTEALLETVKKGNGEDTIGEALSNGSPVEKALARRLQKMEENREEMVRRSDDLYKVKTMAEFQRFLKVDDTLLSQTEIAQAIIDSLGVTNERQIKALLANPTNAYKMLFAEGSVVGTVVFAGDLFRGKLEKFREDRELRSEIPPPEPERAPGAPPEELSKDGLVGLSGEGLTLRLINRKFGKDPVAHLKGLGINEDTAKKMITEAEKYYIKRADGVYIVNEDSLGSWNNADLAVLLKMRSKDLGDPVQEAAFKTELEASFKKLKMGKTPAERTKMADDKINALKELNKITNGALTEDQQKAALKEWEGSNTKSLALLALLLGKLFQDRVINLMPNNEARGFQNLFG